MTYLRVARIVNTFGIKGEIRVLSETDFPQERFAKDSELSIMKNDTIVATVTVKNSRLNKGHYILSFNELNDINQVESFKGGWLVIHKDQQEKLDEGSYYYHQIIGLNVSTEDNKDFGTIKEILSLGSNDVWVIKRKEKGKKDVLIPYIDDFVKEIDLDNHFVKIELMEGILDED